MFKKICRLAAVLCAAMILLTGCGGGFDFSHKELADAIGVKKSAIDKLEIQPDSDGHTGNEMMDNLMAATGSDQYDYWFENGEGFDVVRFFFFGGKVNSVTIKSFGTDRSGYSVLGIHTGDSKDSALQKAEAYFGKKGGALSESDMWGLTDMQYDSILFSDKKKGMLTVTSDVKTDTVVSVEYSR